MDHGQQQVLETVLEGEEGRGSQRRVHIVGKVLRESPETLEDEEVASNREEDQKVEAEEDDGCFCLSLGVEEEAESQDRAGIKSDDLEVALHDEEEEEAPEGIGPEDQGDPEAEEKREQHSEHDEENH